MEIAEPLVLQEKQKKQISLLVIVAALGYFVDIYDLLLFSVIRVQSLKGIGITNPAEITSKGLLLLNLQMGGMLVGGFLWGILGDKYGRLTVLFGSILLYSLANIANGFAPTFEVYAICRVLAGLGLAGELGAGITLVSESMSKEHRGYGTMIVASVGLVGAVVASLVGGLFSWQTSFFIGGGLGFTLLLLRIGLYESGMFKTMKDTGIKRGSLFHLFGTRKNVIKYFSCVAIALPLWYIIGLLISFGPEFGKGLGVKGVVVAGKGVMYTYIGIVIGDLVTGLFSQWLKSRKQVVAIFLGLTAACTFVYLFSRNISLSQYYLICGALGFATGYWVIFVTLSAEQFGTNLRATVATSVPNMVRGSLIPIVALFSWVKGSFHLSMESAALVVGILTIVLAYLGLSRLKETFGKELDYVER